MTFDDWLSTCREYKHGDSDIPQHVLDVANDYHDQFDVVHVFCDGGWIFETRNNYWCHVGIDEIDTASFEQATRFLWENHSKFEANQ